MVVPMPSSLSTSGILDLWQRVSDVRWFGPGTLAAQATSPPPEEVDRDATSRLLADAHFRSGAIGLSNALTGKSVLGAKLPVRLNRSCAALGSRICETQNPELHQWMLFPARPCRFLIYTFLGKRLLAGLGTTRGIFPRSLAEVGYMGIQNDSEI